MIRKYLYLILAVFLMAFSVNTVVVPNEIISGGVSGLGVIMDNVFKINSTLFITVINYLLFVVAYFLISKKYALNSAIGSLILFPVFLAIIPKFQITSDDMLASIFGGLLSGIAIFLLYISEGSTGGTTVIGKVVNKYTHISYGLSVALCDTFVIVLGFFVFGFEKTLYALIFIFIMSFTANYLEDGVKKIKVFHVISSNRDLKKNIAVFSENKIEIVKLKNDKYLYICLVNNQKIKNLSKEISYVDIHAYSYTTNATSTYGSMLEMFENAGK